MVLAHIGYYIVQDTAYQLDKRRYPEYDKKLRKIWKWSRNGYPVYDKKLEKPYPLFSGSSTYSPYMGVPPPPPPAWLEDIWQPYKSIIVALRYKVGPLTWKAFFFLVIELGAHSSVAPLSSQLLSGLPSWSSGFWKPPDKYLPSSLNNIIFTGIAAQSHAQNLQRWWNRVWISRISIKVLQWHNYFCWKAQSLFQPHSDEMSLKWLKIIRKKRKANTPVEPPSGPCRTPS